MNNYDLHKTFNDGFKNDFTLEEFKNWALKSNQSKIAYEKIKKDAAKITMGYFSVYAIILLCLEFAGVVYNGLYLLLALLAILIMAPTSIWVNDVAIKILSRKHPDYDKAIRVKTDLSEINSVLHNYSLYRFMNSLDNKNNNDYKNITDDLKYSYMQAYQFIIHNGIQIQHYANTELDTELDKISEYNEQSSRQNDDDMNALMSNLTHGIRTDENTDYSDRIL